MKIKSISFENYKAFKEEQKLELKPITLLLGKNSSGKSVITKLFTLLDNSLSRNIKEPLLLNNYGVELGVEFRDLVYGKIPSLPISFKIEYQEDTTLSVKIIQPTGTYKTEFLEWEFKNLKNSINKDDLGIIDFHGFLPNFKPIFENYGIFLNDYSKMIENIKQNKEPVISENLKLMADKFIELLPLLNVITNTEVNVNYIAPFRILPERQYYFKGETKYSSVNVEGQDAYQILIDSYLSNKINKDENSIYNQVSNWYQKNFGWRLEIEQNQSRNFTSYGFLLSKDNIKVNLADVGQGMHQALPLVVRAFMDVEDSIVVIEQPELHLHTFAHADLAELFAKSAKTNNQTFVIETHAENMLLRLRKLVIENDFGFTKDDIIIYWVDENENGGQKITPITIDEEGTLSDWFDDAFNENLQEMYAMDKALAKKNKSKL